MECPNQQDRIRQQLEWVEQELERSKRAINSSGLDCTSAPFIIVSEYCLKLKHLRSVLMCNLDDS